MWRWNTSTIALHVIEGNETESSAWGYNWAALSLEDINTETLSSRLGVGEKLMTLL
jgi:hypothetical protein